MHVSLKNDVGNLKQCKIGFSWTTFFFGCLTPFCRGDFKWGLISLAISFFLGFITVGIGYFLIGFCFAFFYNRLYINDLLARGYKGATEVDEDILRQKM